MMLSEGFARRGLHMRLVFVLHSMTQVCMEHVQCSIKLVLTSNTESSTCGIFVCFGCIHSMLACLAIKYYWPSIYVNIAWGATCVLWTLKLLIISVRDHLFRMIFFVLWCRWHCDQLVEILLCRVHYVVTRGDWLALRVGDGHIKLSTWTYVKTDWIDVDTS